MGDALPAVVINTGTGSCKVGLASDAAPREFPTIVGCPKHPERMSEVDRNRRYVGEVALQRGAELNLSSQIIKGRIQNYDDMDIWEHIFHDVLQVAPEEHDVVLTNPPYVRPDNLERLIETMFETFNVAGLLLEYEPLLSLHSAGRTSGMVVSSGYDLTYVAKTFDGGRVTERSVDVAGRDLTEYMMKTLNERGYAFTTFSDREIVREMKERLAYVALDFEAETESYLHSTRSSKTFNLPDGSVVTAGSERFGCPEALFQPSLIGKDTPGIHTTLFQSIMDDREENRSVRFRNIVLAGGSTMFEGFQARLTKEMVRLAPTNTKINVIAHPDRKFAAWIGGSILASHPNFTLLRQYFSRNHYANYGPDLYNLFMHRFRSNQV